MPACKLWIIMYDKASLRINHLQFAGWCLRLPLLLSSYQWRNCTNTAHFTCSCRSRWWKVCKFCTLWWVCLCVGSVYPARPQPKLTTGPFFYSYDACDPLFPWHVVPCDLCPNHSNIDRTKLWDKQENLQVKTSLSSTTISTFTWLADCKASEHG